MRRNEKREIILFKQILQAGLHLAFECTWGKTISKIEKAYYETEKKDVGTLWDRKDEGTLWDRRMVAVYYEQNLLGEKRCGYTIWDEGMVWVYYGT